MYSDAQKREHIYDIQRFLRRVQQAQGKLSPLVPDGFYGPETSAAVRDFQRENGLPSTGTVDYETWTRIVGQYAALLPGDALPTPVAFFPVGAEACLSPGDRNSAVAALQLMLNTTVPHFPASSPLPLTGEYNAATAASVRRLQNSFQLPETGVTDRATWERLALLHNSLFYQIPLQWRLSE